MSTNASRYYVTNGMVYDPSDRLVARIPGPVDRATSAGLDVVNEINRLRDEARKEHAVGMRWTCEQAGHPKQLPDDVMCICETWARHIEAGAVYVDCT
jgi:hypothetical protein